MRSFVPLYLGFESITPEQIIKDHIRPLAKTLLGGDDDGLIPVLDGTLAMYGPRIATKWPVVVTTTIGLTSGLDL
jgi:hypothetical protein